VGTEPTLEINARGVRLLGVWGWRSGGQAGDDERPPRRGDVHRPEEVGLRWLDGSRLRRTACGCLAFTVCERGTLRNERQTSRHPAAQAGDRYLRELSGESVPIRKFACRNTHTARNVTAVSGRQRPKHSIQRLARVLPLGGLTLSVNNGDRTSNALKGESTWANLSTKSLRSSHWATAGTRSHRGGLKQRSVQDDQRNREIDHQPRHVDQRGDERCGRGGRIEPEPPEEKGQ